MKKTLNLIGLLVVLAMILAACPAPSGAPEDASSAAPEATAPAEEAADSSGDAKVALEFWHAMGGNLGELVDQVALWKAHSTMRYSTTT